MRTTAILIAIGLLIQSCGYNSDEVTQVSEQPAEIDNKAIKKTAARSGRIGFRAHVNYSDIEAIANAELPPAINDKGSRKVCKKVLGLKLCGTANWDITVTREADLTLIGTGDRVRLQLPLRIDGTTGIDGKLARALGLSHLDLRGAALANIDLGIDITDEWCPVVRTNVSYQWIEKPKLEWQAGIDFSMQSVFDQALDKQLATLEPRINDRIDCKRFRNELAKYWKPYSFPLSLPEAQTVYLNIAPDNFAFSGVSAEPDQFGVSFALDATLHIQPKELADKPLSLPPLKRLPYTEGRTSFDLLIRAGYDQLEAVVGPHIIGQTFYSDTAAGHVAVKITSIGFSGAQDGLTVAIGFDASLPATRKNTEGLLYLTATPVIDFATQQISLGNIKLSRVMDNRLWSLISVVFENQIIQAVEQRSVLNLRERIAALETLIADQLSDTDRTGGLLITAKKLKMQLLELIPEAQTLTALTRVSAELDIDIPLSVLQSPPGK
ncbi:MAG: DUF4403 family protein [Granulosicoccus sp.]